jgi:hypothetical protein
MASGLVLSYSALQDPVGGPVGVVRDVLSGKVPTPGVQKVTPAGGASGGSGGSIPSVSGKYKLGAVKPHVEAAANKYGPKFGISDIGGLGGGSVPNSDHPRGLALDFMISAKTDLARGNALAAALLADSSVTYVIWNRKINSKNGKGWRAYFGPSNHTDHVHASFKP